jgi:bacterioferritin
MCENWGYKKLHLAIRKQAMDEMHHAEWLIEWIIFLDGTPTVSKLNNIKIGKTVSEMISNDGADEVDAISTYNDAIKLAHEVDDEGTVDLLIKILKMEEGHVWRTTRRLPERGRISIFNRSYYEEVLIVRVHPEILCSQGLPDALSDENSIWEERYRSIVDLEEHLHRNGTRIIKFFLHLSKEEQRKRFLARIDDPDKNWKFSLADVEERTFWEQYIKAYEACLSATSTKNAPWYVVPADDKKNARLIISEIILNVFNSLKMTYTKPDAKRLRELKSIRKQL